MITLLLINKIFLNMHEASISKINRLKEDLFSTSYNPMTSYNV